MEERSKKRILKFLTLLVALSLAMACGVVLGGGGVYLLTEVLDDRDSEIEARTITLEEVRPERGEVRIAEGGVTIVEVMPDSPAEEGGLQEGDRIVAVDGQEIGLSGDLAGLIAGYEPGDRITLEIERDDGDEDSVRVRLGENPEREGIAYLGVRYSVAPSPRMHGYGPMPFGEPGPFGFHYGFEMPPGLPEGKVIEGTRVVGVVADSPADAAGLEEGDVITAIDGEPVADPQELVAAIQKLEPGDEIVLSVFRTEDAEELEVEAELGEHPDQKGKPYLGVEVAGYFRLQGMGDGELPGDFGFEFPFDPEEIPHFVPPDWHPDLDSDA